jgi:NAD(P)-dependent dehydrogenase (short-subunit alcohol dehydrogenase family)
VRGLQDKVVVVAAGGTGTGGAAIGGMTARRLADEGAKVVVGDINTVAAEETVRLIAEAGGVAVAQPYDAADPSSASALIERAVAEFGRLDGVHFNAMDMSAQTLGVDSESDVTTLPIEVWRRTLDVGLTGLFLIAQQSIPRLVEGGGGGIVCTASGAVYAGEPVRVAYATTKTAMTAVIRHIASRWGREGVRANAVAPGLVLGADTAGSIAQQMSERMLRHGRSLRLGQPEDIAAMVTFLLSDDGAWVNGQTISVDGGQILGR